MLALYFLVGGEFWTESFCQRGLVDCFTAIHSASMFTGGLWLKFDFCSIEYYIWWFQESPWKTVICTKFTHSDKISWSKRLKKIKYSWYLSLGSTCRPVWESVLIDRDGVEQWYMFCLDLFRDYQREKSQKMHSLTLN